MKYYNKKTGHEVRLLSLSGEIAKYSSDNLSYTCSARGFQKIFSISPPPPKPIPPPNRIITEGSKLERVSLFKRLKFLFTGILK